MAKNKKQENKSNKPGVIQWVLVIGIPTILAIIVAFIIFSIMGIDVISKSKDAANKIPFLSDVVTTDEEKEEERESTQSEDQLAEKNLEIESLETELANQTQTIDDLNQEIVKLSDQAEEVSEDVSTDQEDEEQNLDKLTKSYEEMDPESAAPILSNVERSLATTILGQMKDDKRGAVLSAMDPEIAAELTQLLLAAN